jgi:hypothetical protein
MRKTHIIVAAAALVAITSSVVIYNVTGQYASPKVVEAKVVPKGDTDKGQQSPAKNAETEEGCVYNGATYSPGAVTCQAGHECVCGGDGGWQSTGHVCDSKNTTLVKGQATTKLSVHEVKTGEKALVINDKADDKQIAAQFPCVSFFGASPGKLGIRNNCAECKLAVVMWTPTVGVMIYQVPGYSQIFVDVASSTGQLIGEEPCH